MAESGEQNMTQSEAEYWALRAKSYATAAKDHAWRAECAAYIAKRSNRGILIFVVIAVALIWLGVGLGIWLR